MYFIKVVLFLQVNTFLLAKNVFSAEGMPQFNASTFPSQIFWLVITFVILYLLISFVILPRIRDNIRLRKNKISNDLERAELIKNQIDKIILEYNEKVENTKNRANQNIKNALEKSEQELSLQIESVKQRIVKKISEAEKETLDYKKSITSQTNQISKNISALLVNKVLGQSLNKNDIEAINNQVLSSKEN